MIEITLEVNGVTKTLSVEPRRLLADVLRQEFNLCGVHIGCAHGACGCCTVHQDGTPRLSCLTFAVQCDGASIRTVESLGGPTAEHSLQQAFRSEHGLQCGYCTPGFLMTLVPFVDEMVEIGRRPDDEEIREAMSGNICRCTGYHGIVAAVRKAIDDGLGEGSVA
ncbi:(2Fe-2S)-binding protein [Pseudaminobacter sp. 19-2017]|uniref:(2Fe-2S)-binding protein n=1 Tax=Pseudaminobacter soli (ex Zhang et al. 2022) TaxID=2831468 RepID=A0A942I9R0_9HYPH|nr:(2Fe-2S)-binding protein [Pseudaminobacter soli]MBS3650570.1 (2Fe-2S)-binding protein [Pseudaminobacter soli]